MRMAAVSSKFSVDHGEAEEHSSLRGPHHHAPDSCDAGHFCILCGMAGVANSLRANDLGVCGLSNA